MEWVDLVKITNIPEVHEALTDFSHDPNETSAAIVVKAILNNQGVKNESDHNTV